jgi:eukaryotic-like serine/threonine-protein kinase
MADTFFFKWKTTLPLEKFCRVCNQSFADSLSICPNDGFRLEKKVQPNYKAPNERLNLICRTCSQTFNASFSVCPNDGSPLERILFPGTRLVGRYLYEETLGQGGMGVVYKARHQIIDRIVAIKMLVKERMSEIEVRRFQREGKAASRLHHPNIVNLLEFGVTDEGSPYMVMDYVDGINLGQLIGSSELALEDALDIALQICSAMEHAHAQGIVHRDLKPTNVMLQKGQDGKFSVKIVDFGIAKISENETDLTLTKTGEIFGSPAYMSPEQGQGKKTDLRTDIYSFGVILYEMLTGVPPFTAESPVEMIIKHTSEAPPPLHEASFGKQYPASLEHVVARTLAKDPNERFQSFQEFRQAFQECFDGRYFPLQLKPSQKTPFFANQQRVIFVSGVSAALLVVGILFALPSFINFGELFGRQPAASDDSRMSTRVPKQLAESSNESTVLSFPSEMSTVTPDAALTAVLDAATSHYFGRADLRNNRLTPDGLKVLGKYKKLHSIEFGPNVGDQVFDGIEGLPLTALGLASAGIKEKGLTRLAHIRTLSDLNVSNLRGNQQRLGTEGLKGIAKLTGLRRLALPCNDLRVEDIKALVPLQHLESLDLSNNDRLDNSCIPYLSQFPKLNELYLRNDQKVTATGLTKLRTLPNLTVLDLVRHHNLCDSDLLLLVRQAPALQRLYLGETGITDEGLMYLTRLINLSEVGIEHCRKVTRRGVMSLKRSLPACIVYSDYDL